MKQYAFSIKSEKVDSSSQPPSVKPSYYQETLNHLIRMGVTRGWKEHTWFRVQELERHPLGLWKGIQQEFLIEIDNAKTKVRTYEELQANRNQIDSQTQRGMETSGRDQVAAGSASEVIGK